jgi:FecR-like protein
MKRMRPFVVSLLGSAIALAIATPLMAQTADQGMVKVVNIRGSARYMTSDNTWRPLKSGTILRPGSVIQTASDSYVDVVLNNASATTSSMSAAPTSGSASTPPPLMNASKPNRPKVEQDAIRIFENTLLGFDKLTVTQTGAERVTETQLDLKHGRIFGTVKKLSATSKYEIKIPNGVAGIRGTIYLISSDGELSVLSSLSDLVNSTPSGSVVFAYFDASGNVITQVVADGQSFSSRNQQLSPIADSVLQNMLGWAGVLGFTPGGTFVEFAQDRTVYLVSPTMASVSP